jgi:hypothetical protein
MSLSNISECNDGLHGFQILKKENILTSYGPNGKSKIISNSSGTLVITKDGYQIIEALLSSKLYNNKNNNNALLEKTFIRICKENGQRCGDGSLTSILITNKLLEQIESTLNMQGQVLHINNNNKRIKLLRSLNVILEIINRYQDEINLYMIKIKSWRMNIIESNNLLFFKSIWLNILIPSSNYQMAHSISKIIYNWLLESKNNLNNKSNLSNEKQVILKKCQQILKNINVLIVNTPSVISSSLDNSFCLPLNEVFLQGARCHDLSLFQEDKNKLSYKFLCIKHLIPSIEEDSASSNPIIQVPSLSSLLTLSSGRSDKMKELATFLKNINVSVLFISSDIEDQVLFEASSYDLIIVCIITKTNLKLIYPC